MFCGGITYIHAYVYIAVSTANSEEMIYLSLECLKEIMDCENNKNENIGYNLIIKHDYAIDCFVDTFDNSSNIKTKSLVIQLLNCIFFTNENGMNKVIDALQNLGKHYKSKSVFDCLVQPLAFTRYVTYMCLFVCVCLTVFFLCVISVFL